jgi:16S rRNA (adenine1518-N6/adenine1519-N6)-dimethyltransferase
LTEQDKPGKELLPALSPPDYNSVTALKSLLESRGLGILKQWGQHFLINGEARKRLLDALEISAGDGVWEIGPGLGAMTAGLLERGAAVTAFEIDGGFAALLTDLFGGTGNSGETADTGEGANRFTLVHGDVLKTWEQAAPCPYLLGNLPYTIAATLLGGFIEKNRFFTRMVVTVQREVARRMIAPPASRDYSSFSVLCASSYTMTPLMVLKGASFYPPPHVESQGIRFDLRTDIDPAAYSPLFKPLVRGLFRARRKTVKNNLENFINSGILKNSGAGKRSRDLVMAALERSGISPRERAENLGLGEFTALTAALEELWQ